MKHEIIMQSNNGTPRYADSGISLRCERDESDTRLSMTVRLTEWEEDAYLLLPACAYDGNRFEKRGYSYPAMYREEDLGVSPEPIISDVPALHPDGSGEIRVTSADLSVPCVGVFYREKKQALFIFFEQEVKGKNIGIRVTGGKIELQLPAARTAIYRKLSTDAPSEDTGIVTSRGEEISSRVLIAELPCRDLPEFFRQFFLRRKSLLSDPPAENGYTDRLFSVLEKHMNDDNFSGEYYGLVSGTWQCGWVGGGMSSLPLLEYGDAISRERAIKTIDFMTSHVAPTGFFYTVFANGKVGDDGFGYSHMKDAMLTRKCGDGLYFLFKHFEATEPKAEWVAAARGCADAFVKLYEKYGDFGQFVNIETGEMLFGGTTAGAPAVSALASAFRFFGDERYLRVAREMGEKYYEEFVARGYTCGGPAEAVSCPDSESSYAVLEAMVLLYEQTGEKVWLDRAVYSLHLFSTWVMPYAYRFPEGSEFVRLGINTVGSVFANVQNKHSAPGICTASGDAIYKLYCYTGEEGYLELLREIALFMPQCVSTAERPILSRWGGPAKEMPSGWICERVNTSDWEGRGCIGEVFFASCWCETSLLLTFSELLYREEIRRVLGL